MAKDINNHNLDSELVSVLRDLVKQFEREDSGIRDSIIKNCKEYEQFWHGVQFIYWSESRQDWISPADIQYFEGQDPEEDTPFYDYVVNIFKPHGESIIAALCSEVPGVRFPPDDAENADDLMTSKTYSKISDLISKHNKAKMLMLQVFYTFWVEGPVFAYHCPKTDDSYGMNKTPNYSNVDYCAGCEKEVGEPKDDEETSDTESEPEETQDQGLQDSTSDSSETQAQGVDMSSLGNPQVTGTCPDCGGPLEKRPIVTSETKSPKSRVMIETYGNLHVKTPYRATKQEEFGYLILKKDFPTSYIMDLYEHIEDTLNNDKDENAERDSRFPSNFGGPSVEEEGDNATLTRVWFRPWEFKRIGKDKIDIRKKLEKKFPDGCYIAFAGSTYAESRNESMDKFWTSGKSGLSRSFQSDAIGKPLVPINKMRNVLTNLTLETIEQGIPMTFADKEVVDFNRYRKSEARPGVMFPVKPAIKGDAISKSFFEGSRATLSREVDTFRTGLDSDAQFTVGSFPSIYGGPSDASSRTASEYNQSRQMALQRLGIVWAIFLDFWSTMQGKCVKLFVESMVGDERYVVPGEGGGDGNYINVWIKQSEMQGTVGDVEPIASETFPISAPQKQEVLFRLLGMQNDFINAAMFDPENRHNIADCLSWPDLFIPGEDQRIKQMREVRLMMTNGQMIPTEPLVDDASIHIETLKNFMVGATGLETKVTNPMAYQAFMQHLQMHESDITAQTMQPSGVTPPGVPPVHNQEMGQ